MKLKTKSPEDFWSGLMFLGVGLGATYLSRDYPMGSALRMGPGYFPTWLGGIMTFFGLLIFARSFKLEGEGIPGWSFRPWLVLCGTIAAFGVFLDYLEVGFVPAVIVLIIGCALAHKDVKWMETIMLSVFLTGGVVGLFIFVIGLPYRLFWWSY